MAPNFEEKMLQRWVEFWLKARTRGDKEISINEMMKTAAENAYDSKCYSEQTIKMLQSHSTEAGRQRFLRKFLIYLLGSDANSKPSIPWQSQMLIHSNIKRTVLLSKNRILIF